MSKFDTITAYSYYGTQRKDPWLVSSGLDVTLNLWYTGAQEFFTFTISPLPFPLPQPNPTCSPLKYCRSTRSLPPPSWTCKFYSIPTFVVHIYFYSKNLFSPFHCFVINIFVIKRIFPYPFGRIGSILKIAKYIFSENHQVEKLTTKK